MIQSAVICSGKVLPGIHPGAGHEGQPDLLPHLSSLWGQEVSGGFELTWPIFLGPNFT